MPVEPNTIVTVQDLTLTYPRTKVVDMTSLMLVHFMARRESSVASALAHVYNAMDTRAVGYNVEVPARMNANYPRAFHDYMPREAKKAIAHLMAQGFFAYRLRLRTVDGNTQVAMPVVQDPSVYAAYVCTQYDGSCTVVCLPNGLGVAGTMGIPLEPEEPLQTYVWDECCPDASSGELTSPLGNLIPEWMAYMRAQVCDIRAMIGMSNPTPVFEEPPVKETGKSMAEQYSTVVTAGGILAGNDEMVATYKIDPEERVRSLQEELHRSEQTMRDSQEEIEGFFNNPAAIVGWGALGVRAPGFKPSIIVPPGFVYKATAAPPQPPTDMAQRRMHFISAVASRIGVPLSVLGYSASVRTTVAGENDAHQYVAQMSTIAAVACDAISSMFEFACGQRTFVNLPVRVPHSIELIRSLYEMYAIDKDRFYDELERATGISSHGTTIDFAARMRIAASLARSAYMDGARLPKAEGATGNVPFATPSEAERPKPDENAGPSVPRQPGRREDTDVVDLVAQLDIRKRGRR